MHPKDINISDYTYNLPLEKIAQYPVKQRDESKLLVASDIIIEDVFKNVSRHLPSDSLIIFNDTRVIHARLEFIKSTGAKIEIFLLNPLSPVSDIELSFGVKKHSIWNCFVGNLKKWKSEILKSEIIIDGKPLFLEASYIGPIGNSHQIDFKWNDDLVDFGCLIEEMGKIPLPPYMTRRAEVEDNDRYQTIYAKHQGSVAAPTAGLHFSPKVLDSIEAIGIQTDFVTLDVGAGTFKPVSAQQMENHEMHVESIHLNIDTIQNLIKSVGQKKIIAVGTTTTRSLESLFWFGNKLAKNPDADFYISQWEAYEDGQILPVIDSLKLVMEYLKRHELSIIQGQTQIIIAPGYKFKIVDILITNFHQPNSTLLLLVAAFYGQKWKDVYAYAITHNFRFLSYGDSCLFIR